MGDGRDETIYKRILDDEEFRTALMDLYASRIYQRLRESRSGTPPELVRQIVKFRKSNDSIHLIP